MAEFLQSLPENNVLSVARRSQHNLAAFNLYGWGFAIAKGASQPIKVISTAQYLCLHA